MCARDYEKDLIRDHEAAIEQEKEKQESKARQVLKQGTCLGAASLGLLIAASSLTMPHQQSRRDALGCDASCVGSMTSARSTLTFIGAIGMGRVSDSQDLDKYGGGRRLCLIIGIVAAATGLVVSNRAESIRDLWMSLIPSALQQNVSILKACLSEYHGSIPGGSSPGERASSAGSLGMAAGLAMMLGPLVGATLLNTYDQATLLALVSLILAAALVLFMPRVDGNPTSGKKTTQVTGGFLQFLDVPSARSPPAVFMLTCRLLSTLSFHVYQTIWTVSLRDRFQFGPQDYGRFFSMIGLFFALSQGFLAKWLLDRFGGHTKHGRARILAICTFIVGLVRYLAFQTHSLTTVYFLFAAMVIASGVISTICTADFLQIAAPEELGCFFGLLAALDSVAGILAGILAGACTAFLDATTATLLVTVSLNGLIFCMVLAGYERVVSQNLPRPIHNTKRLKQA
jgi:hypothetical protein